MGRIFPIYGKPSVVVVVVVVGLVRIELTTSSLSVTRSNRLSYSPAGLPIYNNGSWGPNSVCPIWTHRFALTN